MSRRIAPDTEIIEQNSGAISRAVWAVVRLGIFFLGLLFVIGGGWMLIDGPLAGLGAFVVGLLLCGVGCLFVGTAIVGTRASVDYVFTDILSEILNCLF